MGAKGRAAAVGRKPVAARLYTAVLLAGYLLILAVNLPGHATVDSILQLHEGRTGVRATFGPVVYARILGLFDSLLPGTAIYVAVSSLVFFAALISLRWARGGVSWLAVPLALALMLTPQVLIYQGIVWKDVLFANLAIAGFVTLAHAGRAWGDAGARTGWLALTVGLFAIAILVRQNGLLILAPAALSLAWAARREGVWRGAAWAAGLVALTGASALAISAAADMPRAKPTRHANVGMRILQHYDLAGAAAHEPGLPLEDLDAADPAADDVVRAAARAYSPERVEALDAAPRFGSLWKLDSATVGAAWRDTIVHHPKAYLSHRVEAFRWVLTTPELEKCLPVATGVTGLAASLADLNLSVRNDARDQRLAGYASRFYASPLFSHLAFAGLSVLVIGALLLRRDAADGAMIALQVAALGFAASFFVISLACDYRYLYFLDLAAMTGLLYVALDPRLAARAR